MNARPLNIIVLTVLSITFVMSQAYAAQWTEYAVSSSPDNQQNPDVDGNIIVWQQEVELEGDTDWDILAFDIDTQVTFPVAEYTADQQAPSISGNMVTWQDNYWGDWDIYVTDITERQAPVDYLITPYLNDQSSPVIHGNTVIWQHHFEDVGTGESDWDIYGANIAEPNSPSEFTIAGFASNQSQPAIYRDMVLWTDDTYGDMDISGADVWMQNKPSYFDVSLLEADQNNIAVWKNTVVWQDNFGGDFDIYAADISEPNRPEELSISIGAGEQINPGIYKHIIVWQDDRNGNWDIYGYNLFTKTEFVITDSAGNQTNPAISGDLVVWQDDRNGNWNIYAVELTGPEIADCTEKVPGDANQDCKIDMTDFAILVSNWLECNLWPKEACW